MSAMGGRGGGGRRRIIHDYSKFDYLRIIEFRLFANNQNWTICDYSQIVFGFFEFLIFD